MSKITDAIEEAVATSKPTKCMTCTALGRLDEQDRAALVDAHKRKMITAKQVGAILTEHAGFTGNVSHTVGRHFREGHSA